MRAKRAPKRKIIPDPLYNSRLVTRLINKIMRSGQKATAQRIVYSCLDEIEKKAGKNPITVLEAAIANVSPRMEVRPRRVGGASYQVPVEVRGDRKEALAIRWLLASAASKSNKEFKTFAEKLTNELIDASNNAGAAIKKRDDVLRMAEANRAFSHFRW